MLLLVRAVERASARARARERGRARELGDHESRLRARRVRARRWRLAPSYEIALLHLVHVSTAKSGVDCSRCFGR